MEQLVGEKINDYVQVHRLGLKVGGFILLWVGFIAVVVFMVWVYMISYTVYDTTTIDITPTTTTTQSTATTTTTTVTTLQMTGVEKWEKEEKILPNLVSRPGGPTLPSHIHKHAIEQQLAYNQSVLDAVRLCM